MSLKFKVGERFPSFSLKAEDGQLTSLGELSGGMPLLLVFFRGPW